MIRICNGQTHDGEAKDREGEVVLGTIEHEQFHGVFQRRLTNATKPGVRLLSIVMGMTGSVAHLSSMKN